MDTHELSPKDTLKQLHDLQPAQNEDVVGRLADALTDAGQSYDLAYLRAGDIAIGHKMLKFSFMLTQGNERNKWQEYVSEECAEAMIHALQRIQKSSKEELFVDEIIICNVDFKNPNDQSSVNGVTLTNMEQSSENTIVLFTHALSVGNYRDELEGISHIEGVITHEYGHCLDNASGSGLQQIWVEQFPWQYDEATYSWTYEGKKDDFVTTYAGVNPSEDLAESYAIYMIDPKMLEEKSPERKHFFDMFFNL